MGIVYNSSIVRSGLVLHLDAANKKSYPGSGTVWTDLSGQGNTGTLTNGPTYSSANGGSIVFDGVDDVITTTTLPYQFLTTGVSISVGFNYTQTTNNDNLISWGNGAFNGALSYSWEIRIRGSGNVEFAPGVYTVGSFPARLSYTQTLAFNGRNIILDVTYIPNGLSYMYENGQQRASYDYSGAGTYTNTQSLRIGRGTDTNFPGGISFVRLYNRVLSAAEIRQNFEATRDRYGI